MLESILARERERHETLEGYALVDALVREEALVRALAVLETGDFECHLKNAVGKI
ncbi:MAG: hypothetical protein LRZ84_14850 [Desertifilum sp.]|nr:hypothetical protein [Desertifilum sp.]